MLEEGVLELVVLYVVVDGCCPTDVLLKLEVPINEGGVSLVGEKALDDVVALLILAE